MLKSSIKFLTVTVLSGALVFSVLPEASAGKKGRFLTGVAVGVGAAILLKKLSKKKKARRSVKRKKVRSRKVVRTKRNKSSRRHAKAKRSNPQRSSGINLLAAQTALATLGLYTITIDGKSGPGTRAAVSNFQQQSGYPVTGILTRQQYQQLVTVNSTIAESSDTNSVDSQSFAYSGGDNVSSSETIAVNYDDTNTEDVDVLALPNTDGELAIDGNTDQPVQVVAASTTTVVREVPLDQETDPDAVPELVIPN